jgi:ABC-type dipeptide/oligopeptide/nickel transport system ATPase component
LDQFLSVSLTVTYGNGKSVFRDLFLQMRRGEILGLVGGSGSGKSTLALGVMRLLDSKGAKVSGCVYLNGRDLISLPEREMRQVRGKQISLVLQSPSSALNPMLRLGTQLKEAWRAHCQDSDGKIEIARVLESVSLPKNGEFMRRYPSEVSVGQGQRILIAMAILHSPQLLIADEPTSALDHITQLEILSLFRDINKQLGTGILMVSHDLLAIESICDRVAVLHEGRIVECNTTSEIFGGAVHPYTKALVRRSSPVQHSRGAAAGIE